jgi:hypothetical protein
VDWLKVKTLSSNSSTAKKKKKSGGRRKKLELGEAEVAGTYYYYYYYYWQYCDLNPGSCAGTPPLRLPFHPNSWKSIESYRKKKALRKSQEI